MNTPVKEIFEKFSQSFDKQKFLDWLSQNKTLLLSWEKEKAASIGSGVQESKWIRFEDKKPKEGQPIFINWPSGNFRPEYRELSKHDLQGNWDTMLWLPIPMLLL